MVPCFTYLESILSFYVSQHSEQRKLEKKNGDLLVFFKKNSFFFKKNLFVSLTFLKANSILKICSCSRSLSHRYLKKKRIEQSTMYLLKSKIEDELS